ncbi:MAG: hypothetical protein LBJ72_10610 [Dysgonamonadaceae bacterium]|nr:hypothetical protein [Dysgonamonadaceae bacterium]
MKNSILFLILSVSVAFGIYSCSDTPIDDDGLLVTERAECYISMFELLGPDNRTVLVSSASVDTLNCTVTGVAKFGTNIKHVKPYCGLVSDAKMTPAMGDWIDFSQPRQYTVISGNRQVKKTYTITITVQGQ